MFTSFRKSCLLAACLVLAFWQAGVAPAGVLDVPISQVTRVDSLYTTQNYFGQNMKLIVNSTEHNSGSVVRGLIAMPSLPSLSGSDVYSARIWMCETYYYAPADETPYTRGVTLYPLTQHYNLQTVTWQNCSGGQYDASNPVAWNPPAGIPPSSPGSYDNGNWWCNWNFTSIWNNSNLLNNGAIVVMSESPSPSSCWVTKIFASNTYGLTEYQPFVEVVQMDRWTGGSANWSGSSSWNTGTPPNTVDSVAGFLGNAAQNQTVTIDGPVTVGSLVFDNSAHAYTLAGSGDNTITLSNLSGEATIAVNHGSHEIAAPLVMACNATVTVLGGSDVLTLSGDISGAGAGLTLTGSGTLILSGTNSYDGGTTVGSGTLRVTSAESLPDGSSLNVGASSAVVFNSTVADPTRVDYRAKQAAPVSMVPEPAGLALLLAGLVGLGCGRFWPTVAFSWRRHAR